LQQFFTWLVHEEEIERNPMDGAIGPIVPEQPVPVLAIEEMRALLDTCKGNSMVERRDHAIIRLLIDTGAAWARSADSASMTSTSTRPFVT
jgi:site-specific recombinase XerC